MPRGTLLDEILACEIRVWDALVSGDAAADGTALADDFLGVYPDGFAGKDSHTGQLTDGATVARFALSEPRVMPLGPGHVLLAYHARYVRIGRDEPEEMYVSSIWRRDDGGWVNVFSQDTPATGVPVP